MGEFHVGKDASLTERVAGFKFYTRKSKRMPIESRNAYLNNRLKPIINGNLINHHAKKYFRNPEDLGTARDFVTSLDFAVHIGGVDRAGALLKQIATANKMDDTKKLRLREIVAYSMNPKRMADTMEKAGVLPELYKVEDATTPLLSQWSFNSTRGVGVLIRRSLRASIGESKHDFQDNYHNLNHFFINELDSTDKIPDNVVKSLRKIHDTTKKVLQHKPLKNKLYRGLKIPKEKDGIIKPTVSSATDKYNIAKTFAGGQVNPSKEHEKLLHSSVRPYVDSIGRRGSSTIMEYNTEKLARDGKIFCVMTPEYMSVYEHYGLDIPPGLTTENEILLSI